jgi:hypothetical protein
MVGEMASTGYAIVDDLGGPADGPLLAGYGPTYPTRATLTEIG